MAITRDDIELFIKTGQMPNDSTGKPAKRFRKELGGLALSALPDRASDNAAFAWLIEDTRKAEATYYAGSCWTTDHGAAIRYARELDAFRTILSLPNGWHLIGKAVEHGWHDKPAAPPAGRGEGEVVVDWPATLRFFAKENESRGVHSMATLLRDAANEHDTLRQRLAEMTGERDRLLKVTSGDCSFLHAEARDGNLTMGLAHPLVAVMADALAKQIGRDHNYCEMRMKHKETGEEYTVHCQRLSSPTPHEKRMEAEQRAAQAEALLQEARKDAERYRWLRDKAGLSLGGLVGNCLIELDSWALQNAKELELDAAIDAQRALATKGD